MKTISLFIVLSAHIYADTVVNLETLLEVGLKNNSSIQIEKYIKDEKQANILSSKAAYLPTLSASADISAYEIEQSNQKIKDNNVKTYSLSAQQLIYDFGKTQYSIKASKNNYQASVQKVLAIVSKTTFDIKKAYYTILKSYELIEVAKQSLRIDEQQLYKVEEYV